MIPALLSLIPLISLPSYNVPSGYGAPEPSYGAPQAGYGSRNGYDRNEMYGPYGDILEDEEYRGVTFTFTLNFL